MSFSAPVALAVNMTVYPGGARKKDKTSARASFAHAADSFELSCGNGVKWQY